MPPIAAAESRVRRRTSASTVLAIRRGDRFRTEEAVTKMLLFRVRVDFTATPFLSLSNHVVKSVMDQEFASCSE
jgi:hypothetical protein